MTTLPLHLQTFHSICLSAFSNPTATHPTILNFISHPAPLPPTTDQTLAPLLNSIGIAPSTGLSKHTWDTYKKIIDNARREWHQQRDEHSTSDLNFILNNPILTSTTKNAVQDVQFFIKKFEKKEFVGTHPFLMNLHTFLTIQRTHIDKEVEWHLDDAIFTQSGGDKFMHDAVMILRRAIGCGHQVDLESADSKRVWVLRREFKRWEITALCSASWWNVKGVRGTGKIVVTDRFGVCVEEGWWDWVLYWWETLKFFVVRIIRI